MAAKKKSVTKKASTKKTSSQHSEARGVAGFTLAISGFALIILSSPALSLLFFIVGFIFSYVQQKSHSTKHGRLGMSLNIIGAVVSVLWWILLVRVILPSLLGGAA